uniref:TMV resistance protein N n=1 Tax=Rhizophora mucronata TaxID=61149 RepID=A0A2P2MP80_RHIMU
MRNLSMPGSEIPDWFSQEAIFSERKNHELRAVIIGVVVSLDSQSLQNSIGQLPAMPDILVRIHEPHRVIFSTALYLLGLPRSHEDQVHLCWYPQCHPLVSMLKEGCKIDVIKRNPSFVEGVHLKKHGIYLVYEDDVEIGGNEEILDESQQSVSQRLAKFFNSIQEDGHVS